MTRRLGFLRTRVGRRFLYGNLVAALLPLAAISGVSYAYVRAELRSDAEGRVARLSKSLTLSTLSVLDNTTREAKSAGARGAYVVHVRVDDSTSSFGATSVRQDSSDDTTRTPASTTSAHLTDDDRAHLATGRPLLVLAPQGGAQRVLLAVSDPGQGARAPVITWHALSAPTLWSGADEAIAGEDAQYCVFTAQSKVLVHCAPGTDTKQRSLARERIAHATNLQSIEEIGGYFVAMRDIYLRHQFGAETWRAVVLQPAEVSYHTLRNFGHAMALIMGAVLILIFLVSHTQIRRATDPLAQLQEGTQRLQCGDFSKPVIVTSGDEYAELAESFNGMASSLNRQLLMFRNLGAIDQVALGASERQTVVEEALLRIRSSVGCTSVSLAVPSSDAPTVLDLTTLVVNRTVPQTSTRLLPQNERDELFANPRHLVLRPNDRERSYVPQAWEEDDCRAIVLPLINDGLLVGVVSLCGVTSHAMHEVDVETARRMADRVALALQHVRVLDQLSALSSGTMIAFARAIDANSAWTAGHSERVTHGALAIGRELQLSEQELVTLERGAILHDIGKIAVPASILDKPGRLTPDEWEIMKSHPVVGCDILSPIPAFTDALPIVRAHHERMDGAGYPDGLAGEEIPFLARVLAVADVFDALTSARPYRAGLSLSDACAELTRESSRHLDPRVVLAFLDAARRGAIQVEAGTPPTRSFTLSVYPSRRLTSLST